jgi:DNA-binding transcriptional MerR regulator
MATQKTKLRDLLKYSEVTRLTGINEKMLYRYDNNGAVSKANTEALDKLVEKLQEPEFMAKTKAILNGSEPAMNIQKPIETPTEPINLEPLVDSMRAMGEIVGEVIERIVKIEKSIDEVIDVSSTIIDTIGSIVDRNPSENSKELTYQIATMNSTLSRLDAELKELKKQKLTVPTVQVSQTDNPIIMPAITTMNPSEERGADPDDEYDLL